MFRFRVFWCLVPIPTFFTEHELQFRGEFEQVLQCDIRHYVNLKIRTCTSTDVGCTRQTSIDLQAFEQFSIRSK